MPMSWWRTVAEPVGRSRAKWLPARTPTADGKTLYVASHGSFVINAVLRPPTAYDPLKAFAPVALVGTAPSLFIVRADYPAATLAEFIARAKQGGKMTYASSGAGTTMHIAGEQLNVAAGIKLTHVPYRGAAPAINDLLGGHVDIMNADLPVLLSQVTSGKARALALAATERTPLLPSLPDHRRARLSGCPHGELVRAVRPGGTCAGDTGRAGKSRDGDRQGPRAREHLNAGGVRGTLDGKAFRAQLDREFAYWGPEIKKLGITAGLQLAQSMRMSARSLASRFDSGSSNSSTEGWNTKARASATRCCWPPESCEAPRSRGAHLHHVERAVDLLGDRLLALAAHAQAIGDVLEHRHVRPDRVGLEHHREAALLGRNVDVLRGRKDRRAADADFARDRLFQARRWRARVVDLPQPEGPSSVSCSPGGTEKLTPRTAGTSP